VGSVGHVVHSGAFGAENVGALFFMLGWDRYGFHEKRAGSQCAKCVFLHLVGSMGHVVHSGASEMQNVDALFFILRKDHMDSPKARRDMLHQICVFASSGICGSRCHSGASGVQNFDALFYTSVELVRIP
jgi:hypothetical protein